jgi:hypothetical protein
MALLSATFAGDTRLERCLVDDSAHLTLGVKGDFVGKVQAALMFVDDADIAESELDSETYGQSTAAAVLKYKQKRSIINTSYQTQADNIVGKMNIKALDAELQKAENSPDTHPPSHRCPEGVRGGET